MDQYEFIRTGYRVYGKSISELSRITGHSRNTIKKAIRGEPWGYKERRHQAFPVLGPYMQVVNFLLSLPMLLLAFTAPGNMVFLTRSPAHEFPKYFSYLSHELCTWNIHHASLALSHDPSSMKRALFSRRTASFFSLWSLPPHFIRGMPFCCFLLLRTGGL